MKRLAIETSTELASIALKVDEKVYIAEKKLAREHAAHLLPMIENVLQQANLELKQLDGIAFGAGPGSFTGLRVACSIAKGLAFAHDLPLYPMCSLGMIAESVCQNALQIAANTRILAMLDARMQQVYWAVLATDGSYITAPVVSDVAEIICPKPFIIAGVGFAEYGLPQYLISETKAVVYPHAQVMLGNLWERTVPVSAKAALPFYVRNQITQGEPRG